MERRKNPALKTIRTDWEGNIVVNGRFCNDLTITRKTSLWSALKWKLKGNPQKEEKRHDVFKVEVVPVCHLNDGQDKIVWLGHSSFFISINGIRLVTDPCLGNLPIAKRQVTLPCSIDSLTGIDYLLISHDHRDHLDKRTVKQIMANNPSCQILAPLGMKNVLPNYDVQEAGWWQEYRITRDIRIIFLPARHWGRRGLNDRNKVLWGSFVLMTEACKLFFAGDTAYSQAMFREIHAQLGDIDICLLPIGAYSPAWMMSGEHMNPEEAFRAFENLGGSILIPMHYGTYDLSDEPLGEPIRRLWKATSAAGRQNAVVQLPVGKVFDFYIHE